LGSGKTARAVLPPVPVASGGVAAPPWLASPLDEPFDEPLTPCAAGRSGGSGKVLPGSITKRRTRCGGRNCGCHADPPRPACTGLYWQWTRKIAARTICRWLSADQHGDYTPWIDNDRRLRELLAQLEALGTTAFEADPRWNR
jgi:hypothetical protein